MPYIIYKSNGLKLTTVADGSIESKTTPLTFVGKNYAGYGEILDQNLAKLLENFANSAAPNNPMTGQLWYDTSVKLLKFYDGARFKKIQSFDVGTTAPTTNTPGDLFFNNFEQKLYLFNGERFILIGPQDSQLAGTSVVAKFAESGAVTRPVLDFTITDTAGNKDVAVVSSKDEFTLNATDDHWSLSYTDIKPGLTLPGADQYGNSLSGNDNGKGRGFYFWGTAGTATGLVDTTVNPPVYRPVSYFAKQSDLAGIVGTGLNIDSDNGVLVGSAGIFRFHADSGAKSGLISGVADTRRIVFRVYSVSQAQTTATITLDQNVVVPNSDWGISLGSTATPFTNVYANNVFSSYSSATTIRAETFQGVSFQGTFTGALTGSVLGNITSDVVNGIELRTRTGGVRITENYLVADDYVSTRKLYAYGESEGSSGQIQGQWTLIGSSTLKATYSDIAERYHADAIYDEGTVLVVGGTYEVTTTNKKAHTSPAGIVSTKPAYMMNEEAGPSETHPYIALKGRIPCKVIGPIYKGDRLVTGSVPGYAQPFFPGDDPNAVLAIALEDFEGDFGKIEVKV
jgi:hypothetical protein